MTRPELTSLRITGRAAGGAALPGTCTSTSSCPGVAYWDRSDPYWAEYLWATPPALRPRQTTVVVSRHHVGGTMYRHETDYEHPDTTTLPPRNARRIHDQWNRCLTGNHHHTVMSFLGGFHTAFTGQILAACGLQRNRSDAALADLHRSGLVARGVPIQSGYTPGRTELLWELNNDKPLDLWTRDMRSTHPDDLRAILASPYGSLPLPTAHIRHNVLTAELALRVMETSPRIVGALGSIHSSPAMLLAYSDLPRFAGDATLLRDDGLRIVIEVVASRNTAHVANKMARWGSLLAGRDMHDTALNVVFVNACRPTGKSSPKSINAALRDSHRQQLSHTHLTRPDGGPVSPREALSVRQQIHLASWEDWFPEPRIVSAAGQMMAAISSADEEIWLPHALADPSDWPLKQRKRRWALPTRQYARLIPDWAGQPATHRP